MTILELFLDYFKLEECDAPYVIAELCPTTVGLTESELCCCECYDIHDRCTECWNQEAKEGSFKEGSLWRIDSMPATLYQMLALRTEAKSRSDSDRLTESLMGLSGEAGEAIDILKKHKFQGHDLDKEALALELGDIAWYLAEASSALGYSLNEILKMNIMKLHKRYPNGFEPEKSINR